MHATIWHNPACGTSRNTLALIRHAGIEPEVIEDGEVVAVVHSAGDLASTRGCAVPSIAGARRRLPERLIDTAKPLWKRG